MGVLSERLSSPPLVRLPEILLRRATQHSFTLRNPTNQKRNEVYLQRGHLLVEILYKNKLECSVAYEFALG